VITNVYAAGKVIRQTDAFGNTWAITYNPGSTIESDQLGRETTHFYDTLFRETKLNSSPQ